MNRSFFFFFLVACGGGTTTTLAPGQPPSPPDASAVVPASTDTSTFAIDHLSLGEGAAWKSIGYNLDRATTVKDSNDVCTLQNGAPKSYQVDGNDGIDNAFGANIVPLIQTGVHPQPSELINEAYIARKATLQIVVTGLPADGAASAIGLRASTFVGADASSSSAAEWPVMSGTESDFVSAYVTNGTFVSGSASAPVRIDLPMNQTLALLIHDAVITFDRAGADVIEGTIAGVLDVMEFGDAVRDFALRADPDLCTGSPPAVEGLVAQIHQTADILDDGTNVSGAHCGGISIGLQFTAHRIASSTSAVAPPPQTPPCN